MIPGRRQDRGTTAPDGENPMIDFYFWTTPNGYKPLLFLEEAGVPHTIKPVNI